MQRMRLCTQKDVRSGLFDRSLTQLIGRHERMVVLYYLLSACKPRAMMKLSK